jgi:hypothetical protein
MSSETQNLASQQDKLMKNIDRLEPMLGVAEGMMEKMGKLNINGMQERVQKMVGSESA